MALLINGDVLQYTVKATYQGQIILNTYHWMFDGFEPVEEDYEEVCEAILANMIGDGDWIDTIQPALTSNYNLLTHQVQKVAPQRIRAVTGNINAQGTGGANGSTVNQAAVVTKHGAEAARWAIGSWHQCGLISSAFQADGTVAAAQRTVLLNAVNLVMNASVSTEFPGTLLVPILWSAKVPGRKTQITGQFSQATARVMRRRTVGLGI